MGTVVLRRWHTGQATHFFGLTLRRISYALTVLVHRAYCVADRATDSDCASPQPPGPERWRTTMMSSKWLEGIDLRLGRQFGFLLTADRLKTVTRGSRIADASRRENTAERSWHLALFAIVLAEWAVDRTDVSRVIRMLILHDLVEIECGDTPPFGAEATVEQLQRERAAAGKIFGLLPADRARGFRG